MSSLSFDKLLYSWLPICTICFKSPGLLIPFILWYIKAHKLIATNFCLAFCQNTTSPFLCGSFIVLLGSTCCMAGPGFSSTSLQSLYLYNCLYELDSCTHYMGNYMKTTLSIRNISFHVQLIWLINISHCRIGSISVAGNRPLYKTTLQFKKKVPIYNSLLLRCNYSKVQLKNPSCMKGI